MQRPTTTEVSAGWRRVDVTKKKHQTASERTRMIEIRNAEAFKMTSWPWGKTSMVSAKAAMDELKQYADAPFSTAKTSGSRPAVINLGIVHAPQRTFQHFGGPPARKSSG